jgi:hypothetical protein
MSKSRSKGESARRALFIQSMKTLEAHSSRLLEAVWFRERALGLARQEDDGGGVLSA